MDDFSRYTWLFFLTIKGQALSQFVSFHKMITNQLNTPIKCLQSDIGGGGGGGGGGVVHYFSILP